MPPDLNWTSAIACALLVLGVVALFMIFLFALGVYEGFRRARRAFSRGAVDTTPTAAELIERMSRGDRQAAHVYREWRTRVDN